MEFKATPKELFTSTGGQRPDDYEAYIESADNIVRIGVRDPLAMPQWRTAYALSKLRSQIDAAHPGRNRAKDGTIGNVVHCPNENHTGSSDHCLNIIDGDNRVVAALDITHDPQKCDVDKIVEAIRSDKDSRIKYIIWNKRICNSSSIGGAAPWAWRNYSGSDPHTGHVHFSVKNTKTKYDDESTWKISS